jgi:hypothetical protein
MLEKEKKNKYKKMLAFAGFFYFPFVVSKFIQEGELSQEDINYINLYKKLGYFNIIALFLLIILQVVFYNLNFFV